ncbi:MAG: hypothetical protein EZS28_021308, partial [Streblomastix strix]
CNVIGDNSKGGGLYLVVNTNTSLLISGMSLFNNCSSDFIGGGCYMLCTGIGSQIQITGQLEFENCSSKSGGGMRININNYATVVINQISFKDCFASVGGGGCYINCLETGGIFSITGELQFENCNSDLGGGMLIYIQSSTTLDINKISFQYCQSNQSGGGIMADIQIGGKLSISGISSFLNCVSQNGGGIYSNINDGTLNIEDTTFDRCTCSQPGNGGGIALYQGSSSIISITNSSFIDCKTISNSSDQRYGWGGGIFIQTSVTAENLNESNFIIRDLIITRCSAVNSIGNNLHIQSIDTYTTGEAIKNGNLLTVINQSNPPNIISDLYTSLSYAYDYMGINESLDTSNPGTVNLDLHDSLFEQLFLSKIPNPIYIDSIIGKDIKYCGGLQTMCKTMQYSINRNSIPLTGTPPSDTNYSIKLTSNTEIEINIQITSTTLQCG